MNRTDVLVSLLNGRGLTGYGAEIGVHRGNFSKRILAKWPGFLHLVDAWAHLEEYTDVTNGSNEDHSANYLATLEAVAPFNGRYAIFKMLSNEAANCIRDGSLDWVYIDANHSYEACKEDLRLWWPKVKNGGLFSGHDYLNGVLPEGVFGVKQAVDEFIQGVSVIDGAWPSWYIFKGD
jgi:hypothetical protein